MLWNRLFAVAAALALLASACADDPDTPTAASDPPASEETEEPTDEESDGETDEGDEPNLEDDPDDGEGGGFGIDLPEFDEIESVQPISLEYGEVIELSIADLETFWSEMMPEVYNEDYENIETVLPYDEDTDIPDCGAFEQTYDDNVGNAFYCFPDDYIAFDNGFLFPDLYATFGEYALALVLAHEWGHAIQDQARIDPNAELPTIVSELQADCFAGAWTGWVAEGNSELLELENGDLEAGLGGMLSFSDGAGADPNDPTAHGSGFDRVSAFQEGFDQGLDTCATYPEDPPAVVATVFDDLEDLERGGNAPFDEAIDLVGNALNAYWSTSLTDFQPVDTWGYYDLGDTEGAECPDLGFEGDALEMAVYLCPASNIVAFDRQLGEVAHGEIGDMALAGLMADQWSLSVLLQTGEEDFDRDAILSIDCLTGSWVGAAFNEQVTYLDAEGEEVTLLLSPGDLDESIAGILAFTNMETADETGSAFERVAAFRTGFSGGIEDCDI